MKGTALVERPQPQETERNKQPRQPQQSEQDQCNACTAHFLRQFGAILEREASLHGMQEGIRRARIMIARLLDSPATYVRGYDKQVRTACKQETMHRIDSTIIEICADIG